MSVLNKISPEFRIKLEKTLKRKENCKAMYHQSQVEKSIVFNNVKGIRYESCIFENYVDVIKYIKPAVYYQFSKIKKSFSVFYIDFGVVTQFPDKQNYHLMLNTNSIDFLHKYNENIKFWKKALVMFYPFIGPVFPYLCFKFKINEEDEENEKYERIDSNMDDKIKEREQFIPLLLKSLLK